MQTQKKVVIVAGDASTANAVVMGLVKGGYAVECVPRATDVLDRIGCVRNRCDALVIAQDVVGMSPERLLQGVLESGTGSRTPTVMVGDMIAGLERRPSIACVKSDVAAIADAVGRVLAA